MDPDSDHPQLPTIKIHHPPSPRHSPHHHHTSSTPSSAATPTPTAGARRKIGVAIDLSSESAFAVRWAVDHYIRPGDAVVLLHVSPTSVLYGADWGPLPLKSPNQDQNPPSSQSQPSQEDFDAFTSSKVADLAKPLKESGFPYKIHIVKDHDMRERLCLEIERLGLSAVIMGSRGFGAEKKRGSDGRLGSVSDYCVHHCVCPVVVVRFPDDDRDGPIGPVVTVKTGGDADDDDAEDGGAPHRHEHIKDE
ncbi:Universal stress protein PHOS32 [Hirschfeldia incana]|nr:Universal stress protein PHOS32 [Hirschfeldia incana]